MTRMLKLTSMPSFRRARTNGSCCCLLLAELEISLDGALGGYEEVFGSNEAMYEWLRSKKE
jgi:hypothetical protein